MTPRWAASLVAWAFGAFTGCFSDPGGVDEACERGAELCACIDGMCRAGLTCLDDRCQARPDSEGSQTAESSSTSEPTSGVDTATSGTASTLTTDDVTAGGSLSASTDATGTTQAHVMFVTSAAYVGGTIGSLAAADEICEATAQDDAPWRAILSDSTTLAPDRILIEGPVLNMVGDTIAWNAAELWSGQAQAPVGYDETGVSVSTSDLVWVGAADSSCDDWTDGSATGATGVPTQNDAWLSSGASFPCNLGLAIYCISQ